MQMVKATEGDFDRGDIEVLQVLCGQAASAIETARLAQEARKPKSRISSAMSPTTSRTC
jgi:GAF domain-containing protein